MEVAVVSEMLGGGAEGYVNPLSQTYGSEKDTGTREARG